MTCYQGTDVMLQSINLNSQNRYEIKIYGQMDDSWRSRSGKAKTHTEILSDNSQVTTFFDAIMDQANEPGLIRHPLLIND